MNSQQKAFVDWLKPNLEHWTVKGSEAGHGIVIVSIETGDVLVTTEVDADGKVVSSVITGKNCAFAAARIYPNMFVAERLAMGLLQFPSKGN